MQRQRRAKKFWRIVGQKKFDTIFDETIPFGCITDAQLKSLLKCLYAKANACFSLEDIVRGYVKKGTHLARDYLEPESNLPQYGYRCTGVSDVDFVARIVDENGDRVDPPSLR
jgi:hypothetical protein